MLLPVVRIFAAKRRGWLAAEFKYHPGLVRVVKALPIRRFVPESKCWEFDPSQVAIEALQGTGARFDVAPDAADLWRARGGRAASSAEAPPADAGMSAQDRFLAQLKKLPHSAAAAMDLPPDFTLVSLPHEKQSLCLRHIMANPKFFLTMGTGTGKGKMYIDAARLASHKLKRPVLALLLGPNNKVPDYPVELRKHAGVEGEDWVWRDGRKGADRFEKALNWLTERGQEWMRQKYTKPRLCILGLNWESLDARTSDLPADTFDVLLADEADAAKNPNSGQGSALARLGLNTPYVLLGTATPCPQGPYDLWNPVRMLRPGLLPSTFTGHRSRYGVEEIAEVNGRRFPQTIGYQNLDELARIFNKVSFRCSLDECADVPPVVAERRYVTMTSDHRRAYRAIQKDGLALIGPGVQCVTASAASVLQRLQQICGGFIPHTALDGKPLPGESTQILPNTKADYVIKQLLPSLLYSREARQFVIWAFYRAELEMLLQRLREPLTLPDGTTRQLRIASLWGDTPDHEREDLDKDFRAGKYDGLVSNPASGGIGKEFQTADVEIWYSRTFNQRLRAQGEGRLRRLGQTRSVLRFDVMYENTVEDYVLDSLEAKRNLQSLLTADPKTTLAAALAAKE